MISIHKFPKNYLPFWHIGARIYFSIFQATLAGMKQSGKSTILDIGSGAGWNSLVAALMGFKVTSIDTSEQSLRSTMQIASQIGAGANINTKRTDCLELPFENGSFDIVIASHIIEHLDKPDSLLKEISRVMKPGSTLLLMCPSLSHNMRLSKWLGINLDPPDHKVLGYDVKEIRPMLPDGLVIRKVFYLGRFIESNMLDLQNALSKLTGIRANPVGEKDVPEQSVSPVISALFYVKELVLLPLILLCKLENIALFFMKGNSLFLEIDKI